MPSRCPEFEKVQHALRHTLRTEARYAIRHPELGLRWLLTRVEPATLASGNKRTTSVTLDITEQHQSQQRSEQLLHELTTILEHEHRHRLRARQPAGALQPALRAHARPVCRARGRQQRIQELFAGRPQASRIVEETLAALDEGVLRDRSSRSTTAPFRGGRPLVCPVGAPHQPTSHAIEAIAVLSGHHAAQSQAQQRELEGLARDRELMFSLSEVGIAFVRDGKVQRANEAFAT